MERPFRVVVFMAHPGHARNFERTLGGLAERGHKVHVALDTIEAKHEPMYRDLLRPMAEQFPNLTVERMPPLSKHGWAETGRRLRMSLNYLRYVGFPAAQAEKVRLRASLHVPAWLRRIAESSVGSRMLSPLRSALVLADRSVPIELSTRRYLAERAPDAVVVTPLVELGSRQVEYVRAAKDLGIPTALLVASWDNLTLKGGVHEIPDRVTVWSERQVDEAVELHGVPRSAIKVTGAVAYDHWFAWSPNEREAFCRKVGLDPSRPFLLYLGSSKFIAPKEAFFVADWVRAIRDHRSGSLGRAQVLIRPHPTNPLRGDKRVPDPLGDVADDVVVYPPAGQNPTADASRQDYFDSLYHCAGVVAVNTSGMIEAAIVGRPVHTVLDERYAQSQQSMLHFQHLRPENGGFLRIADTMPEHAAQLEASLANGSAGREKEFLRTFIRPRGLTRPASGILVDEIEALAETLPDPRQRPRLALRPFGFAMALAARAHLRSRLRRSRVRKRAQAETPDRDAAAARRARKGGIEKPRRSKKGDKGKKRAKEVVGG